MSDGIRVPLGHVNLRGDAADRRLVEAVEAVLGQPLPVEPNRVSLGDHRVYWLGPDEWQIVTDIEKAAALAGSLRAELEARHAAVNDLSGGFVALHLSGRDVPGLLAKGCTLDLDPVKFGPGACAQTGLAKAGVLLGCIGDEPLFELVVRRSFADYLLCWLRHAGMRDGGNG